MSKIICDICGTAYSDTETECPICGCAKDASAASLVDELLEEEFTAAVSAENFANKIKKTPAFDEDDFLDDEYDDEDDEEDEDEHKSNAGLVIALVLVVLTLIALSAFILVKFFLPNVMGPEPTAPPVVETTDAPVETTELRIPCESLALTSGGEIVLEEEGANWLINVMALPENTTDALVYASSDEAVVTVNEQGKLTAVSEGTAVITISCGAQEMKCTVTCDFTVETTAPSEPEETTDPSAPEGETTAPTEPEETTAPTEPLKNVTLKVLKYTDLTFNAPGQGFSFVLEGLRNDEVKWTSLDEKVVTVDENGFVTSVGMGTTTILCEYGSQKVEIKINCKW